jgi:geranylgeranyl reductase family protein
MGKTGEKVLIATVHDVAIVGAGPAGLVAARTLAAAGHDVMVLEEHARPGTPVHCTGLIGLEAFDEMDLPAETILSVVRSAVFCGPSGEHTTIRSNHVLAAVLDRGAFDAGLETRALGAGAVVACGMRVETIEVLDSHVVIRAAGDETVLARVCILACGASYRLNRLLGLGTPCSYVQSAQIEMPFAPLEHIEVHLGRDTAPGGFAWVVPFKRGEHTAARVGLMCQEGAGRRFGAFVRRLSKREGLHSTCFAEPRRRMIPLGPVPRTFANRVLAVGDAAGLIKPTTGGGIYYGLISGQIAAEVLDDSLRRDALDADALGTYETRWRARLNAEIRAGQAFRAIASRLDDRAIEQLIDLGRADDFAALLVEHARFNWHRKAALALLGNATFRRIALYSLWRQSLLSRPFQSQPAARAS